MTEGPAAVPDSTSGRFRRRRRYIRVLLVLTAVVVAVDIAAAALQIVSNNSTGTARAKVTRGLAYEADMGAVMRYTLDAESAERGYLLTGQRAYLDPAAAAIRQAPATLSRLRRVSRADPVLSRDLPRLQQLLRARLEDLVTTVGLYRHGRTAAALARRDLGEV